MSRSRKDHALMTFAGGVWSPEYRARVDLEKAPTALRTCKNFVVEPYGSLKRRPGLKLVGAVRGNSTDERIDILSSSGTRGVDDWSLSARITLSPTADPSDPYYTRPVLVLDGTFNGNYILYGIDCITSDDVIAWMSIFRPESFDGLTILGHEVWGPPDVQSLHGNSGSAFWPPQFGDPEYDPNNRQTVDLQDGIYYRYRIFGQIDPSSEYGNFAYSRWFTLATGFLASGFTPP